MGQVRVDQLPGASSLTGTELVPLEQGGILSQTPLSLILSASTASTNSVNSSNPAVRSYLVGLTMSNNGASGVTCSFATNKMTVVSGPTGGAFSLGQSIEAAGVAEGTYITAGTSSPYTLSTSPGTIGTEWTNSTDNTINIAAGQCMDSTLTKLMNVSALTKTTSPWVIGSGVGGLDVGTILASTWYDFYAIYNQTTLVTDIVFSLSPSLPSMPIGFALYRYIGSAKTDAASNWIHFTQTGREFYWSTPILETGAGITGSTTASLLTCTVPVGRKMKVFFNIRTSGSNGRTSGSNGGTYLSDPANADLHPSGGGTNYVPLDSTYASTATSLSTQVSCWSNTSAQIRHRDVNTNTMYIVTLGWMDLADSQL